VPVETDRGESVWLACSEVIPYAPGEESGDHGSIPIELLLGAPDRSDPEPAERAPGDDGGDGIADEFGEPSESDEQADGGINGPTGPTGPTDEFGAALAPSRLAAVPDEPDEPMGDATSMGDSGSLAEATVVAEAAVPDGPDVSDASEPSTHAVPPTEPSAARISADRDWIDRGPPPPVRRRRRVMAASTVLILLVLAGAALVGQQPGVTGPSGASPSATLGASGATSPSPAEPAVTVPPGTGPSATPPASSVQPSATPSSPVRPSATPPAGGGDYRLPVDPQPAIALFRNGTGGCALPPTFGAPVSFTSPASGRIRILDPTSPEAAVGTLGRDGSFDAAGADPLRHWQGTLTLSGGTGTYQVINGSCIERYDVLITFQ
jgi:hypothetical protein